MTGDWRKKPRATKDYGPRPTCGVCGGKGTITRLTGSKDADGKPTTETVPCPEQCTPTR